MPVSVLPLKNGRRQSKSFGEHRRASQRLDLRVSDSVDGRTGRVGVCLDAQTVHGASDDVVRDDNVADGRVALDRANGDTVRRPGAGVALERQVEHSAR